MKMPPPTALGVFTCSALAAISADVWSGNTRSLKSNPMIAPASCPSESELGAKHGLADRPGVDAHWPVRLSWRLPGGGLVIVRS